MAERQLPKLHTRGRIPLPPPMLSGFGDLFAAPGNRPLEDKKEAAPWPLFSLLAVVLSISRGAPDSDGGSPAPNTRGGHPASSRHWCTDCRLQDSGNWQSDKTA